MKRDLEQVAWGAVGDDSYSGLLSRLPKRATATVSWGADEDVSGLFSSFKKALRKVSRTIKKAAPTLKYVAGGAALVFPPAAPVAAGIAVAATVVSKAEKAGKTVRRARKTIRRAKHVKAGARLGIRSVRGGLRGRRAKLAIKKLRWKAPRSAKARRVLRGVKKGQHLARAMPRRVRLDGMLTFLGDPDIVGANKARRRYRAIDVVKNTAALARKGDPGAQKALEYLRKVRAARKRAQQRGRKIAWVVDRSGFVHRVL